jgi:nucleotide-binding universal stress UspA family protein
MAVRAAKSLLRSRRPIVYERIVAPLSTETEPEQTLSVACRLAADHHGTLTAVVVLEVPAQLPLDAHMAGEETEARRLLSLANAVADSYGVRVVGRVVRARDSGTAIVEEAARADAELVVLSVPRWRRLRRPGRPFGRTARFVLERAPCRVLLVSPQRLS